MKSVARVFKTPVGRRQDRERAFSLRDATYGNLGKGVESHVVYLGGFKSPAQDLGRGRHGTTKPGRRTRKKNKLPTYEERGNEVTLLRVGPLGGAEEKVYGTTREEQWGRLG